MPPESDIAIIGGGITGITSAYLLALEGKKVVVMEREKVGEGMTAYTTGFLTQIIDIEPVKLIKKFGLEKARLILASHREAIDAIEKIIKEEQIECEFMRCTNYIYANTLKEQNELLQMREALQQLGVPVEYKKDAALVFKNEGYLAIPNQAKFNAPKYVAALAGCAKKYGALIQEGTEVKDATSINAKNILVATYASFNSPPILAGRSSMYRSYILEFRFPIGSLVEGIYQDSLEPYHYFRVDRREEYDRVLLGGADDLEAANTDVEINFEMLRTYATRLFAGQSYEETQHWAGRILNSRDGLAYIGADIESSIYYATAFSGNGLTYSYIASKMFVDQILSRPNPYVPMYALDRKTSWFSRLFN